jgi:PPP family 3-phenylpropionic acid transporter
MALRLSALSAAVFFGNGIHLPFYSLFLASRGFDARQVGAILAIAMSMRVLATPVITALADRGVSAPRMLVASHMGMGVAYSSLLVSEDFAAVAVFSAMVGLCHAGASPLQDVILTREVARDPSLVYGRLRLWGTVAFMAGSLIAGQIAARWSLDAVVAFMAIAFVSAVPICAIQPWRPTIRTSGGVGSQAAGRLINGKSLLLIFSIAASHASHAGVNGFGSLLWQSQGYGARGISLFWAVAFLSEILLFWLAGRLATQFNSAIGFLILGASAAILRWLAMTIDGGPMLVVFGQMLNALSFAVVHISGLAALTILAPEGRRGAMLGVATGAVALTSTVTTFLAGQIYAQSPASLFAAMAGMSAVSLVGFSATAWLHRRT